MCNEACIKFAERLTREDVKGKRVIEVGSMIINGSLRDGLDASNLG
jgi:hypothetical protein